MRARARVRRRRVAVRAGAAGGRRSGQPCGGGRAAPPAAAGLDDRADGHRVPAGPRAAAGPGQLRARPRRRRRRCSTRWCGSARRSRCWPPAGSRSASRVSGSCRSLRCRPTTPRRCSPTGRGPAGPASTPTARRPARSSRSADASTACRWRSSWPRPGCGSMNAAEVAGRLGPARGSSAAARAARRRATRASSRRSTGPTGCCPSAERLLFDRLSVFAGGFDLDAAHGVCGDPADAEDDTLDLLAGLVDKSMVTVDHAADATWYRLLETMRQYGRERLVDHARLDEARDRHARYLVDLTARAGVGLFGPDEAHWVERLTRAYDDLRVAVQWAINTRDADLALRLVVDLPDFAYWRVGCEVTDWSEAALQLPGAARIRWRRRCTAAPPAAPGAWATTRARSGSPAPPARPSGSTARRAAPNPVTCSRSSPATRDAIDEAIAHYERQVELARPAADPPRLNWALFHLAMCRAAVAGPAGRPARSRGGARRGPRGGRQPHRPVPRAAGSRSGCAAQGPGRRAGAARGERGGRRVRSQPVVLRLRPHVRRGNPRRALRPRGGRAARSSR